MRSSYKIRTLADIEEIEKVPLSERVPQQSTLELLEHGAAVNPDAVALSFIADAEKFDQLQQFTYRQLLSRVRRTANLLHDLGVRSTEVVSYLLPNLPQTHFVLWGAEAAGIANPINPLLEADTIRDICTAARTKVLAALGEFPRADIWSKVEKIREQIPGLAAVVRVMGPSDPGRRIYGYEAKLEGYPGDRLIFERRFRPEDAASYQRAGDGVGAEEYRRESGRAQRNLSGGSAPRHRRGQNLQARATLGCPSPAI